MNNLIFFNQLLNGSGVQINGEYQWDLTVKDNQLFERILTKGSIAFGEGYMDKQWECDDIAEMINRLLRSDIENKLEKREKIKLVAKVGLKKLKSLPNKQNIKRAKEDVSGHYNIGNNLYRLMLDNRMTYTCGYWKGADTLDEAQEAKLDLLCRKLGLKKGMRVLDIGCGWGSFMFYAAEKYGVICDGLTLSEQQMWWGREKAQKNQLPVHFILKDYREFKPKEKYDRIVSVGMLEHVGPKNYKTYFRKAYDCLVDEGIFLVHTIGNPATVKITDPWINKYIFPNGVIPSMTQISQAIEGLYNIEDLHNIGEDYDKTLCAWYENFSKNWQLLNEQYDERFYRMWTFYLLSCAGAFRSRQLSVWQIALTKMGAPIPDTLRIA